MRDAEDVTRPRGRPGRGSWSPPWAHAFSPSGHGCDHVLTAAAAAGGRQRGGEKGRVRRSNEARSRRRNARVLVDLYREIWNGPSS